MSLAVSLAVRVCVLYVLCPRLSLVVNNQPNNQSLPLNPQNPWNPSSDAPPFVLRVVGLLVVCCLLLVIGGLLLVVLYPLFAVISFTLAFALFYCFLFFFSAPGPTPPQPPPPPARMRGRLAASV